MRMDPALLAALVAAAVLTAAGVVLIVLGSLVAGLALVIVGQAIDAGAIVRARNQARDRRR
jgi:hypothetical protein